MAYFPTFAGISLFQISAVLESVQSLRVPAILPGSEGPRIHFPVAETPVATLQEILNGGIGFSLKTTSHCSRLPIARFREAHPFASVTAPQLYLSPAQSSAPEPLVRQILAPPKKIIPELKGKLIRSGIMRGRVKPGGAIYFSQHYKTRKRKFTGHPFEVTVRNGIILQVEYMEKMEDLQGEKRVLETHEWNLIYQNGDLVDSCPHGISKTKLNTLGTCRLRMRLSRDGLLSLGSKIYHQAGPDFSQLPVEIDVVNGCVVVWRICENVPRLADAERLIPSKTVELPLLFQNGKWVAEGSKLCLPKEGTLRKRLPKVNSDSRTHFQVNMRGTLLMNVPSRFRGLVIEIEFRNRVLVAAGLLEKGHPHYIDNIPEVFRFHFKLIYDSQGKPIASCQHLKQNTLNRYPNGFIVTRLSKKGSLTIGKESVFTGGVHWKCRTVAAEIREGFLFSLTLLRAPPGPDFNPLNIPPENVLRRFQACIVRDGDGNVVDSFTTALYRTIPRRHHQHIGRIETPFLVDRFNGFVFNGIAYDFGVDEDYYRWKIKTLFFGEPGKIAEFELENPDGSENVRIPADKITQRSSWEHFQLIRSGLFSRHSRRDAARLKWETEEKTAQEEIRQRVTKELKDFTPQERDLLFEIGIVYFDLHNVNENDADLLAQIAEELGISKEWTLKSFEKLRQVLAPFWEEELS